MPIEIKVIEILVGLSVAVLGLAVGMFRKQLSELGTKVDALTDKMGKIGERIARIEGREDVMVTLKNILGK